MTIITSAKAVTPRRLEMPKPTVPAAPTPPPAQPAIVRKHPLASLPGPGLYGVHVSALGAKKDDEDKAVEIVRQVCTLIANHVGGKTRIVNQVVWLSFDAGQLVEQLNDPEASNLAKGVAATQFVAGTLDLASNAPGLDALQRGVLPLYFSADLGDRIETGRCDVTLADLADYTDDPQAGLAKLTELLK